jgi:zinc transport system ATP-binding protein
MTTHDFSMLPRYADQVVLIDHKVVCADTPEAVLSSDDFRRIFHLKGGNNT